MQLWQQVRIGLILPVMNSTVLDSTCWNSKDWATPAFPREISSLPRAICAMPRKQLSTRITTAAMDLLRDALAAHEGIEER
jgi:hypothetical protein